MIERSVPLPTSVINDPKHWRDRGEEIRRLAEDMKDPVSREMMLRMADDYERLARRAEERLSHHS
jgi:hypothetical protein